MTGAALYMRLSREDGGAESASIAAQRLLLRRWAREQALPIAGEYVDDGVSGTTFDRPAFRLMLRDIEAGKINTVLVKDLSRLGRDYITAGQFTELWFPQHGVRFVAVNDGYDSNRPDTDIAPLKNIINEMYARDISRKIRSALQARMTAGQFTGARPPYGYRRSAANRSQLEPDPLQAAIVRQIFALACAGHSRGEIAAILNGAQVAAPKGGLWCAATIGKLLRDPVYLGHLAQGRSTKPSLKSPRSQPRPPEGWILVENTHERLVEPERFQLAGEMISARRAGPASGFENIFSGLAFCADCGRAMSTVGSRGSGCATLACGGYKAGGRTACSSHFISYTALYRLVLDQLTAQLRVFRPRIDELARTALDRLPEERFRAGLHRQLDETVLSLSRIYADHARGMLDAAAFDALLLRCTHQRAALLAKLDAAEAGPSLSRAKDAASALLRPEVLTRPLLHRYIRRIQVHQSERSGTVRSQQIDICWRFKHTDGN